MRRPRLEPHGLDQATRFSPIVVAVKHCGATILQAKHAATPNEMNNRCARCIIALDSGAIRQSTPWLLPLRISARVALPHHAEPSRTSHHVAEVRATVSRHEDVFIEFICGHRR